MWRIADLGNTGARIVDCRVKEALVEGDDGLTEG